MWERGEPRQVELMFEWSCWWWALALRGRPSVMTVFILKRACVCINWGSPLACATTAKPSSYCVLFEKERSVKRFSRSVLWIRMCVFELKRKAWKFGSFVYNAYVCIYVCEKRDDWLQIDMLMFSDNSGLRLLGEEPQLCQNNRIYERASKRKHRQRIANWRLPSQETSNEHGGRLYDECGFSLNGNENKQWYWLTECALNAGKQWASQFTAAGWL